jgi:hypothetical protein
LPSSIEIAATPLLEAARQIILGGIRQCDNDLVDMRFRARDPPASALVCPTIGGAAAVWPLAVRAQEAGQAAHGDHRPSHDAKSPSV